MHVPLGTSKRLKPVIRNDANFRIFLTAEKNGITGTYGMYLVKYLCFKPLLRRSRFNSQGLLHARDEGFNSRRIALRHGTSQLADNPIMYMLLTSKYLLLMRPALRSAHQSLPSCTTHFPHSGCSPLIA